MKTEKIDGFPRLIDLNDPDDTEFRLIEWAHDITVADDPSTRAIGRSIKTIVPAFCQILREESGRSDSCKGDIVNGLMNASALMLSLVLEGCVKDTHAKKAVDDLISGLDTAIRDRVLDGVETREKDNGNDAKLERTV